MVDYWNFLYKWINSLNFSSVRNLFNFFQPTTSNISFFSTENDGDRGEIIIVIKLVNSY